MTQSAVNGKFIEIEGRRYLIKGVTYGTFAPDATGRQFPDAARVREDFAGIAAAGFNTIRTYTPPDEALLDEAARCGLRVMVGVPWSQHVAFLDDRRLTREIRRQIGATVRALASHPAALLFALGNEIPPAIVRWHGRSRIERFLRELCDEARAAAPDSLLTYVNFPPTEYLDLDCFDIAAFNVYLHRERDLRAYLARLHQIAGDRPLLLAEAGADSIREGEDGQAEITAMHVRAAFSEGLCGAIAFAWTDEWWRGGHPVTDWAFGLVDAERRPKRALAAVSAAMAEAPFSADEQRRWPKVSVVICAYNAADTIADCLASLERLTYPDYEVIVVNDGSRDETSAIAHRSPFRVIDVPNGGLSAARNIGLAAARGEIVAYTDADVRVDPDWLTYLVQPFLTSDVVGSGGPNVVPPDDPWVAQCVARSPGGPVHVLLDDRIAEHVPGCNMAFRRDALLSIQGFNPVYLRAGDDVDVCWRLQARGHRIGFAPSALVWHHHRASVKAYWRQQAGYGEGEAWLEAHHPEKFQRGVMVWHGRIYSPLPFVRSLAKRHINTGVWGTAAFPSVYSTAAHPLQFLPHSPAWLSASTLALVVGAVALTTSFVGLAAALLIAGAFGHAVTAGRCLMFGWRSDLDGVATAARPLARLRHRLLIAWLHYLQPIARFYGHVRGLWSPPEVISEERVTRLPWKASAALVDAGASARLLVGGTVEDRFWSETWGSHDAILTEAAGLLRASRPARSVEVDDGWRTHRDLSVAAGRWGWVDVRALVEEHGGSRCLLRVGLRLRPALVGAVLTLALAALCISVTRAAILLRWPWASLACMLLVVGVFARAAWETTTAVAVVRRALERAALAAGLTPLPMPAPARADRGWAFGHTLVSQRVQAAVLALLVVSATTSAASLLRAPAAARTASAADAADAQLATAGSRETMAVATNGDGDVVRAMAITGSGGPGAAGLLGSASLGKTFGGAARLLSPASVAVAPTGDVYLADSQHNRIWRIDRASGTFVSVAGSGAIGFDGDFKPATEAALHRPRAIAVSSAGDLYIADTLNHRVRVVSKATGRIRTIAGTGAPAPQGGRDGRDVGDGGPAIRAFLSHPTDIAVAPDGDVYIADMGHNRIRVVDSVTGVITTLAGDGREGSRGDGGPAALASLARPAGLALAATGRRVTVYVAEHESGAVRVIDPDGTIATLPSMERLVAPARLLHEPGWLYVVSENGAVTPIDLTRRRPVRVGTVSARLSGARGSGGLQSVQ